MKSYNVPSIDIIIKSFKDTFKRFPLVIVLGWISLLYVFSLNHGEERVTADQWRIVFTLMLGLPLLFSTNLLSLKKFSNQLLKRILCSLSIILSLAIFYYLLKDVSKNVFFIKYIIFSFAAHLFASVCYFYQKGEEKGFWQFNRILFLRFLLSSLYSAILYIGLSLILGTISFLFKLDISSYYYLDIFYVCIFFFHIPLFLSGIPSSLQDLNNLNEYPSGLKTITQYLLIPLVTAYIAILYIYGAQILITWTLPKGLISLMIIMMSVLGILNLLLIHPKAKDSESKWMNTYARFFYAALIPLLFLLYVSIYKRVSDYGFTEKRYYVLYIALWISSICIYFIFNKKKDIRVIPVSLLICSIFSSFGPWGASQISISSQVKRIEKFLVENKVLVDGKVQEDFPQIDASEIGEYKASLSYLIKNFGAQSFPRWKNKDGNTIKPYFDLKDVTFFLGLSNVDPSIKNVKYEDGSQAYRYKNYQIKDLERLYNIKDYDHLFMISTYSKKSIEIKPNNKISITMSYKGEYLNINLHDLGKVDVNLRELTKKIDIARIEDSFKYNEIPAKYLTYSQENSEYNLRVVFENISGNYYKDQNFNTTSYRGFVLITFKK